MKYKAIVWDFFGVISSEVAIIWFEKYLSNEKAAELKEKYIGPVDLGKVSEEQLFVELGKVTSLSPGVIREEWLSSAYINQSVVTFIKGLAGRYKLAILSDAPSSFIREIMTKNHLDKFFDKIIVSSEVHMTKADKNIFRLALNQLDVSAEEVIMIDDNKRNIKVGESVGIKGFTFNDLTGLKKDLSEIGVSE